MMGNTARVSNLSLKATKQDILNFFSFSGEIQHIQLEREGENSQVAFVTFKSSDALDTALLLSGATIVDQSVTIVADEGWTDRQAMEGEGGSSAPGESKAQAVMTNMLAKGYVIGKDAMGRAKAFDEKHRLSANASATISNIDKKIGITEKFNAGTAAVNQGVKAVDDKFQVSGKAKSALNLAEQKVSSAGSALMKNKYVFTSASWVTGAFNRVAKAATDVTQKTKEKVEEEIGDKNSSHSHNNSTGNLFAAEDGGVTHHQP